MSKVTKALQGAISRAEYSDPSWSEPQLKEALQLAEQQENDLEEALAHIKALMQFVQPSLHKLNFKAFDTLENANAFLRKMEKEKEV